MSDERPREHNDQQADSVDSAATDDVPPEDSDEDGDPDAAQEPEVDSQGDAEEGLAALVGAAPTHGLGELGRDPKARRRVPHDGNALSAHVAWTEPLLVLRWRQPTKVTGSELARRCGCSPATISRALNGTQFLIETIAIALLAMLAEMPPSRKTRTGRR